MSDHRDRAEMQFVVDDHIKAVLQFMQDTIPASKLCGVADGLPQMARLLWGHFSPEPFVPLAVSRKKTELIKTGSESPSLAIASV